LALLFLLSASWEGNKDLPGAWNKTILLRIVFDIYHAVGKTGCS
jgi:hypothetical protein